ncbi:unnamed protein product [Effrenium voratum]|uniref:RNA methyltransferase n=1 Tax=Effrenium voratum TaxID=2562239 RepID=A0AA36IE08_9DINO|nr:unnamed protein product [Effrenium voratum]
MADDTVVDTPSASSQPGTVAGEPREAPKAPKAPKASKASDRTSSPGPSGGARKASRSRKKRSPPKGARFRDRKRRPRQAGSEGPVSDVVAGPVIRDNKAIYAYGNYDEYYGKRHDRFASIDARIEALLEFCGTELFEDKVVLDVGCNTGTIGFQVAALGARRVEAVELDRQLIAKALRHLRWLKSNGHKTLPEAAEEGEKVPWHQRQYAVSCVQGRGQIPYHAKPLRRGALREAMAKAKKIEKALPSVPRPRPDFPYNLEFRAENFFISQAELKRKTSYDVVLLLKVTQWIHVYYGDAGIQELFAKVHRLLRLGGLLVLEAQQWQKYLEKKHIPPSRRSFTNSLGLRPERFPELLGQQGFERQTTVASRKLKNTIFVFRKVATPQAERPPLMDQVFAEQQFLMPRPPKKAKVVPPRFATDGVPKAPQDLEAVSTQSVPAPLVPALAAEVQAADTATPETETVETETPPAKRPRGE